MWYLASTYSSDITYSPIIANQPTRSSPHGPGMYVTGPRGDHSIYTGSLSEHVAGEYNINPYGLPYGPLWQNDPTRNSYAYLNPYERSIPPLVHNLRGSHQLSYHHRSTSSASRPIIAAPSPRKPSWSPSRPMVAQISKSPLLAAGATTGRISSVPSLRPRANPRLIQTSTLPITEPGKHPSWSRTVQPAI